MGERLFRVLPDGAVHLVFHRIDADDPRSGWNALAVGATAAPAVLLQQGRVCGLSVRLRPGAAADVPGGPAGPLAGVHRSS